MIRSTIFLLILLTLPVRANLGDDVKQLVARYGTPTNFAEASPTNPFGTIVFQAGAYTLVVFLLNEKEVGARVSKTDQSAFSDGERQLIMSTDVAGSQWMPVPSPDPDILQWTRSDQAKATYDKQKKMLIFTSDAMSQALKAAPASAPTAPAATTPPAAK